MGAYIFGHKVYWKNKTWIDETTNKPLDYNNIKPCPKCGLEYPKSDIYEERCDPCIKDLPGAHHSCCGHGITRPHMCLFQNELVKVIYLNMMKL